jgi:hypothetical protein
LFEEEIDLLHWQPTSRIHSNIFSHKISIVPVFVGIVEGQCQAVSTFVEQRHADPIYNLFSLSGRFSFTQQRAWEPSTAGRSDPIPTKIINASVEHFCIITTSINL